jgi:hypothetical protein
VRVEDGPGLQRPAVSLPRSSGELRPVGADQADVQVLESSEAARSITQVTNGPGFHTPNWTHSDAQKWTHPGQGQMMAGQGEPAHLLGSCSAGAWPTTTSGQASQEIAMLITSSWRREPGPNCAAAARTRFPSQ